MKKKQWNPIRGHGWQKIFLIMRITILFILAGLLQVHASVYSQQTKLQVTAENKSILQVLKMVEDQSDFHFLYRSDNLKGISVEEINMKDAKIEDVLDKILIPHGLTYEIDDRTIVIKKSSEGGNQDLQKQPSQKTVSGKVKDGKGEPLPGASVIIKGTTKGVVTDTNGNFIFINVPENAILQISFTGMKAQEIAVGVQTNVNITLAEENYSLNEVVAVGYGTQKKRDVSTAISSVSSERIKDMPVSNFEQAITGQMAGVRVLNSNNAPGGGSVIRIRGVNSINASTDPLIVIDGFPLKDGFNGDENPFNLINTADIESVEVLKDASSSAIYGTQAANGVIIITTKKGKLGKPTISVNASTGLEQMLNPMKALNKEDFLKFIADGRSAAYVVEDPNFGTNNPNAPLWKWTDDNATRIYNWAHYSSYATAIANAGSLSKYYRWETVSPEILSQPYDNNWQSLDTQIGKVQNFQLSANGGTDNFKYMLSGGFYSQDGIVKEAGYKRFSFRANVEVKINDWLKTGLMLAPTLSIQDLVSGTGSAADFYNMVAIPPIYPAYDAAGNPAYIGQPADPMQWTQWTLNPFGNPLSNSMVKDNRRTINNLATIFAEINLTKDLKFRSELHSQFKNWERNYFLPSNFPTSAGPTSRSQGLDNITSQLYWNSQNFLTYNHNFGKHTVNAVIGYSADETSSRNTYLNKYDYPTNSVQTLNQALTVSNGDVYTNCNSESMLGSFARVLYNYGGKYYLTGSIRRDGSSKFGANNRWGIFPSFSAAWRVSDESFFAPIKQYIYDLKIRGGIGAIGNAGIGNYAALSSLSATSYVLGSTSTLAAGYQDSRVANPKLGWETVTDHGLGIDVQFLKSRISLSVDYFYKVTSNMLFDMPLPAITGFSSYKKNIGSMRNRGLEYQVTTRNLVGDFNWTTNFNLSYYRNRVLNLGADKRPLINNYSYTTENKPMALLWGVDYLGPYKDWEDVKTNPIVNPGATLWKQRSNPGSPKNYDVNGDGVIDANDYTVIGNPNPDFIWGMTNTFNYKGFDLSIEMNGVQGGDVSMVGNENTLFGRPNATGNTIYEYFNNYWTPDRTDAKYAAPNRKSWDTNYSQGQLMFKGTYVKIQNISFGYTLPKSTVQRLTISQLRLYTSIQNALMISKYPGYNPEANYAGNSSYSQAVDVGSYPLTRIISFGINVTL